MSLEASGKCKTDAEDEMRVGGVWVPVGELPQSAGAYTFWLHQMSHMTATCTHTTHTHTHTQCHRQGIHR